MNTDNYLIGETVLINTCIYLTQSKVVRGYLPYICLHLILMKGILGQFIFNGTATYD